MRRRGRRVLGGLAVAVAGVLIVALLAFDRTPAVARGPDVSTADVRRARALLRRHDPRRTAAGDVRTVSLSQQDATLLAQYAASRWRKATARIGLRDSVAHLEASIDLSSSLSGTWLNVDADVRAANGLPVVERLRIGGLPVPAAMADPLLEFLLGRMGALQTLTLARELVQQTQFSPDSVRVTYRWRPDATGRVRDMLVSPEELARLEAYHRHLESIVAATRAGDAISVSALLAPLLSVAATRAAVSDAADENRAALATLALYVTGRRIGSWMRQAQSWPAIPRRSVTLSGREDLAKHFLVSAIVAAQADRTLADAVGLTKEVDDSRGGSGFSFVDLAADKAGTRFGEAAVNAPEALLDAVARGIPETAIMPEITDLPESLTEAQFIAGFGGVGEPRYNAMLSRIGTRIARLPPLK
jgi:hypothetical protein